MGKRNQRESACVRVSLVLVFAMLGGGSAAAQSYGPQPGVTKPAGAIDIWPGSDIQAFVNASPGSSTFFIRAGIHSRTSAITPKSGNTFVGEYGAVLDGTGWTTTDAEAGAFRAHNQDIDDVTIRNLVIRNMPRAGIHAYYWMSDRWTIENNEIHNCFCGVDLPNGAVVRGNYIHHNVGPNPNSSIPAERGGGYVAFKAVNLLFENNEISYNGMEQKICLCTNSTFRNNFVHHNLADGIWHDSDNTGVLIEGNICQDNGRTGIDHEANGQSIIRNNTLRRNWGSGILLSTSRDAEVYGNVLEDNWRGIDLWLSYEIVGPPDYPYPGAIGFDLRNNYIHDNIITVGTRSESYASLLSYYSDASGPSLAFLAPYLNNSKGNNFVRNQYFVPSTTASYWFWGAMKSWNGWQAIPQDTTGSVRPSSEYAPPNQPPSITAPPANQTVAAGQAATFSVSATGAPPLAYQWQKDGADIAGATAPSYTTPATNDNGSIFRAIVTNPYGSATSSGATLTVANNPAIRVWLIVLSLSNHPSGTRAKAQVFIADAQGVAVSGATVTAAWSGIVSGSGSGTTGADGSVTFTSPRSKKSGTFTFTVTGVAKSGTAYDPSQNVVTSDSITK